MDRLSFDWDEAKRRANILKHGIDFFDMIAAFGDPVRVDVRQDRHGEERWKTIGRVRDRIFAVVWTPRQGTHWIISARPAKRRERRLHAEGSPVA